MKYRSDIDGMRCIAVGSVFLYHLNNKLLPGGFSGVDIFFVISGFLITRIIVSNVRENSFSISKFYARRVRRIFPALFTVLLFSALFVVVAFEPAAYDRFFSEFRYAAMQASNFMFSQEIGYFDASAETSPLLHTWSLGVEEQFYLLWPFLIIVIFRICGNNFVPALSVITVMSFIFSDLSCTRFPQTAFYMLHSRAWELGVGGILAAGSFPGIQSTRINNILSMVGFSCLVIPLFALNGSMPFPGRYALLTVIGTALLIYTGESRKTFLYRLLSLRGMVAIGAISYSLYLWHWPLIMFYKTISGGPITVFVGITIILLALLLSSLSVHFIEKPCRYGKLPSFPAYFYQRFKQQKSFIMKGSFYFCMLCIIPALFTATILSSAKLENNRTVTELILDVELIQSRHSFPHERIAIYWEDEGGNYHEENSHSLYYNSNNKISDNFYRFAFTLPDMQLIKGIRLDPLLDDGLVKLSGLSFKGGLLNISEVVDLASIEGDSGEATENLHTRFTDNSIFMQSTGSDPHLVLFKKSPVNFYDKEILFVAFFLIMFLLLTSLRLLSTGREHQTVLAAAATTVLITLLISVRLQYSNYSEWRFIDNNDADLWFTETPITDLSQFPTPDIPDVVLLGDSHAGNYAEPIKKWADQHGLSLQVVAKPACPPIFYERTEFNGESILKENYASCTATHNKQIKNILTHKEIKYVLLAIRQEFYLENPGILFSKNGKKMISATRTASDIVKSSLDHTVQVLQNAGKKVILLGQIPILKEIPKTCLSRNVTLLSVLFRNNHSDDCDINREYSSIKLKDGQQLFQNLHEIYENVYYFKPESYITSIFSDEEKVLYFDNNHLNHRGSTFLASRMDSDLTEFLLKTPEPAFAGIGKTPAK